MTLAVAYSRYFQATFPDPAQVVNTEPDYTDGVTNYSPSYDPGAGGVVPDADDVRDGVAVGVGTGNLRVPAEADVRASTVYDSTDPVKEKTGLLDLPSINDVRLNTQFDQTTKTGNVRLPAEADVRQGVVYDTLDSKTGSLAIDYPSVNDVRLNVQFDGGNLTGTVRVPPVDKVELGYAYDANDGLVGTLDPGAGATDYPVVGDVRNGVEYNFGNNTGTLVVPLESQVESGVQYGAGGTEYVGLLEATTIETSVFLEESFDVTRGDSYTGDDISWEDDGRWPDLAGATVKVGFRGNEERLEFGAVVSGTTVQLPLTKEETAALRNWYFYDVQATLAGGEVRTLARGRVFARDTSTDIPPDGSLPGGSPA